MNKPNNSIEKIDAITICCPNCGWQPESKLFYHLSLSVYQNKNKLHNIACKHSFCNYNGNLIEWLRFTPKN